MRTRCILFALALPLTAGAQQIATPARDSINRMVFDTTPAGRSRLLGALYGSGTWAVAGEIQNEQGTRYRVTGHWSVVADPNAHQQPRRAVVALYLEPLDGSRPFWLGAHLGCSPSWRDVACIPTSAPKMLLPLNFVLVEGSMARLTSATLEVQQPEGSPDTATRLSAPYTVRGRLTLTPVTD